MGCTGAYELHVKQFTSAYFQGYIMGMLFTKTTLCHKQSGPEIRGLRYSNCTLRTTGRRAGRQDSNKAALCFAAGHSKKPRSMSSTFQNTVIACCS